MVAKLSVRDFVGTVKKYGRKHVFEYSHHTVTNKQRVLVSTSSTSTRTTTTSTSIPMVGVQLAIQFFSY